MASTSFSSENSSIGIGAGPTPLARTRSPQNGWSPKKGTIVVGHCKEDQSQTSNVRLTENPHPERENGKEK